MRITFLGTGTSQGVPIIACDCEVCKSKDEKDKRLRSSIMIEDGDKLIFAEDAVFNSPSAASNMILGRNSNGFSEWVNKDGLTFKEVQEKINN